MNFYQVMCVTKFTMLLMCCCLLHVSAKSYGQRITMNKSYSNIPEILQEARKQTGYDFFYDANLFSGMRKVHVKLKNATLEEALSACFKGLPFSYTIQNKIVIINRRPWEDTSEKSNLQQTGRLAGKVLNTRSEPLAKVSILVVELNAKVQTSVDGSFGIDLPVGTYTVQISHVAYQSQKMTGVKIEPAKLTRLDLLLKDSNSKIKEVVVTSSFKKATVSGLLAARKNAASVTDGISAEQFSKTPDNDMGQVLKRVTGVTTIENRNVMVRGMSDRYNQAQLDGVTLPSTSMNKRDFAFDLVPTEIVSSVVVNKSATPDVSAEFSGGQVSVNTLDIPDENFFSMTLGTGGNSQTTGKNFYRLGERATSEYFGFYGKNEAMPKNIQPWYWHMESLQKQLIPRGEQTDPAVADKFLTFQRPDLKYRDLDAIEQTRRFNSDGLAKHKMIGMPNQNFRATIGRVYDLKNAMRLGFVVSANFRNEQNVTDFNNVRGGYSLDYDWMDSTKVGQNGAGQSFRFNSSSGAVANFGLQSSNFKIALKNLYARTYSNNFNEAVRLYYNDLTLPPQKEQYQLPESLEIWQHQVSGEYALPWDFKIEGMYALSKTCQEILDERKLKYTRTMVYDDEWLFQTPAILTNAETGSRSVSNDRRLWSNSNGTNQTWAVSLSKTFALGSFVKNNLKVGYQGFLKRKGLALHSIVPMMNPYNRENNGIGVQRPVLRYSELFSGDNIGDGYAQVYYYPEIRNGSVYEGKMSSNGFYAMIDQQFWNRLRLVYGIRREIFDLKSRQDAYYSRESSDPYHLDNPLYVHLKGVYDKNVRWLPSINAILNITNSINFRASYAKTAIRPDFREVGSFRMYDYDLDAAVGGEHVFSTIIDNTDLRLEWYPSPDEIFSITGYYKYLDAPIELVHNGSNLGYYMFNNMKSATNLGLEFEWRKNLGFLAKADWLSDIYLFGNATLLKSRVKVLGVYDTRLQDDGTVIRYKEEKPGGDRPLMGQSPWLLNLGIGYYGDRFGLTTTYNHRGYRTASVGQFDRHAEMEIAPRQWDAQAYVRFFNKKLEAKINFSNLLNEWTKYYVNLNYMSSYEINARKKTNPDANDKSVGDLRYKKEDGDRILYRKRDGRRYGISLTYNF